MTTTRDIPASASPGSSPPVSRTGKVPTPPNTSPPATTAEATYRRLNALQTTYRRVARKRDALKRRIDRKLAAHDLMLAGRNLSLDYQVALTKHLNDFLEPLYNDLEETEVQLDEIDAGISRVASELAKEERNDRGSVSDTEEKGSEKTVKRGLKRKRGRGDDGGEDNDTDT